MGYLVVGLIKLFVFWVGAFCWCGACFISFRTCRSITKANKHLKQKKKTVKYRSDSESKIQHLKKIFFFKFYLFF